MTVADVQYALASHGRRIVERAEHAINDVVDIGEVARHAALPVNLDRFPGQDLSREAEISHVRAAPRTVDGEEAKAGLRKAIQICVSRAPQFALAVGRRIEGHGAGCGSVHGKDFAAHGLVVINGPGKSEGRSVGKGCWRRCMFKWL